MLIGGRGKAGGIKLAERPPRGGGARARDPGHGHPRLHRPRGVGGGGVGHRRGVLRLDRLRPLGQAPARDALHPGRHGHRGGRGPRPAGDRAPARRPAARLPGLPRPPARVRGGRRRRRHPPHRRPARPALRRLRRRGGDARRGQPHDRHRRPPRDGARREGHARRQRAVPPRRERRAAQPLGRGPAGADGARARADLREARREHRHPGQRGRPRHEHARRRRPGRRRAGELPRRRRRRQGGRDHQRGRGDPLQRGGDRRAVQHLRRHHALRRGRARADRGVRPDQAGACRSSCGSTGPTTRRAARCSRPPSCPTCFTEATMLDAARRVVELA